MAKLRIKNQNRLSRIRQFPNYLWNLFPLQERKNWILLFWLTIFVTAIVVVLIDLPLAKAMQKKDDTVHMVFAAVTDIGKSTIWLLGLAFGTLVSWVLARSSSVIGIVRLYRWMAGYLLFSIGAIIISGLFVNIIKVLIGRARPRMYFGEGITGIYPPGLNSDFQSFPSGHASTVVALATALALFFPRWKIRIFTIGVILALTRVVVNAHYLSDVIVSSVITLFITSLLAAYCASRTWVFEHSKKNVLVCQREGRYIARRLRSFLNSRPRSR